MKTCNKCGEELPLNSFSKDKSHKDGLSSQCKGCRKQYQQNNKVAIAKYDKEYAKQYYQKNKKTIAEQQKQYKEEHSKVVTEYQRQWRHEHSLECCNYTHKHEATKRNLPYTLTIEHWQQCKEHFNNKCAYCGKELPLAQEHFLALTKGGEYSKDNIIPSCKSCNSSKHDRNFFEWYPKYKYYSKKREKFILKFLNYKDHSQQLTLAI